jgi:uncharacterized membrane protein YciS (DUF1049 family)
MRSGDATFLLTKSITVEIYFVHLWREPFNPESAFSMKVQCLLDRFISFYVSSIESSQGNDLHGLSALLRRLLQLRVSSITQQQVTCCYLLSSPSFCISMYILVLCLFFVLHLIVVSVCYFEIHCFLYALPACFFLLTSCFKQLLVELKATVEAIPPDD